MKKKMLTEASTRRRMHHRSRPSFSSLEIGYWVVSRVEPWKKQKEEKVLKEQKSQQGKRTPKGGSILTKKVFEPLKIMLDLYEARLRANQTNEERYRAYPNPELKAKRLEVFKT